MAAGRWHPTAEPRRATARPRCAAGCAERGRRRCPAQPGARKDPSL